MKIVIIGAGSMAFTPALLSGFGTDARYKGATFGFVDVNEQALDLVRKFAIRVSEELGMDWTIEASTERRDVLSGADLVTTAIGVGGLTAWQMDVTIPAKYGYIQPVGDTSGPGGLARALRHIPVLVGIARDMEEYCPQAVLYNFTNPLTVITQAVNRLTSIPCVGLCIGVDLTWDHLCRVIGVDKSRTQIIAGGINHCHWILDFRVDGQDAFPLLSARLDEIDGDTRKMESLREKYQILKENPQQLFRGREPVCTALYRKLGYYPGPGDWHVVEFFPQFMPLLTSSHETINGEALRSCQMQYPKLYQKMVDIAENRTSIDARSFAEELAWEHTQLLDLVKSRQDNLGKTFYVNLPNRGYIHNLPDGVVVEVPAVVDAGGIHPLALGDLPLSILPGLVHKTAGLDLIIEAAMEGSRQKAVQALMHDPYCTDLDTVEKVVNELIDAELAYLPLFK